MDKTRDPVCGMTINPKEAAGNTVYAGQTYYFCCQACLLKFQAKAAAYVKQPTGEGRRIW